MTPIPPLPGPPAPPNGTHLPAVPLGARVPWRAAGLGLTSLGTMTGIWVAAPLLGQIATGIELAAALAVIGTALFGSPELSERAFRLLRWIANRAEPPAAPAPWYPPQQTRNALLSAGTRPGTSARGIKGAQRTSDIGADDSGH